MPADHSHTSSFADMQRERFEQVTAQRKILEQFATEIGHDKFVSWLDELHTAVENCRNMVFHDDVAEGENDELYESALAFSKTVEKLTPVVLQRQFRMGMKRARAIVAAIEEANRDHCHDDLDLENELTYVGDLMGECPHFDEWFCDIDNSLTKKGVSRKRIDQLEALTKPMDYLTSQWIDLIEHALDACRGRF